MRTTRVLAGIVVDDIEGTSRWYGELLGRDADRVPMPSCHEWDLGADVTVQVHQNPGVTAGNSSIALVVEHLEQALTDAGRERFGEVSTVSGFVRTATASDPEGNQVTLVEPLR